MENKDRFQQELTGAFHSFIKIGFINGTDYKIARLCEGQIFGTIVGAKCYDGITQKQADQLFDLFAKVNQEYKKMQNSVIGEVGVIETYDWIDKCRDFTSAEIQKILSE